MKKVLIALALLWPSLASAQIAPYPLGVRPPIFGLPASAVNGGGGFSPSLLGPESCTVPAYSFITAPTNGWGGSGTTTICGVVGGTQRLGITSTAVTSTVELIMSGVNIQAGANNIIYWGGGRSEISSSASGLFKIADATGNVGIQFNTGTAAPTVGTCGTGTITAGSRNTTGSFTATGATACTVTFGAPAWTNAPFCTITAYGAPTTVPYINGAPTTTAFIIAGMTAGDNLLVGYHCVGRF